ncbi:MAG: hypothetical protein R3C44_21185 [Chloroflexota bacterium]
MGISGTGDGQFNQPTGLAIDAAGNIYVGDLGNDRIQTFDSSYNFLGKWGTNGTTDSEFDDPGLMAFDAAGDLYVSDIGNDRVQVFDTNGIRYLPAILGNHRDRRQTVYVTGRHCF